MKKYQTEIDIAVLWSKSAFLTGWVRITFLYEFLAYLRRTRRQVCQWVKQIIKYKYPNNKLDLVFQLKLYQYQILKTRTITFLAIPGLSCNFKLSNQQKRVLVILIN